MNRRSVFALIVATAGLSTAAVVPSASAAPISMPVHAMAAKVKLVKFNLRNSSGSPVKLKAGEESMTLEAGKVMELKLPEGTRITVEEATSHRAAGDLLAEVSRSLAGSTLVIN